MLSRPSSSYARPAASAGGARGQGLGATPVLGQGNNPLSGTTPPTTTDDGMNTMNGGRLYTPYGGSGDDGGYGGDAFEVGDQSLDPFRRQDNQNNNQNNNNRSNNNGNNDGEDGTGDNIRHPHEIHTAGLDFMEFNDADGTAENSSIESVSSMGKAVIHCFKSLP